MKAALKTHRRAKDRELNKLMAELTDTEAIRCCQSEKDSGHKAFQTIYQRYRLIVRSYASRMVTAMALDEVIQETFVRLYKSRHSIDENRPLKPYILRIAHNAALDEIRRIKSSRRLTEDEVEGLESTPRQAVFDLSEAMTMALKELSPVHKAVLLLRHEQKLSFQEIADVLEVSERTARNRLMTAAILFERVLRRVGVFEEGEKL